MAPVNALNIINRFIRISRPQILLAATPGGPRKFTC